MNDELGRLSDDGCPLGDPEELPLPVWDDLLPEPPELLPEELLPDLPAP